MGTPFNDQRLLKPSHQRAAPDHPAATERDPRAAEEAEQESRAVQQRWPARQSRAVQQQRPQDDRRPAGVVPIRRPRWIDRDT